MATKSANLYARIEPDVKEKAESILSTLGIPASSAINMFYKQIILQRGLPFEVKIPLPDLLISAHYQKQSSMKNWRKDMRICRLDGQKMRRKHLLTFARIMAYDI